MSIQKTQVLAWRIALESERNELQSRLKAINEAIEANDRILAFLPDDSQGSLPLPELIGSKNAVFDDALFAEELLRSSPSRKFSPPDLEELLKQKKVDGIYRPSKDEKGYITFRAIRLLNNLVKGGKATKTTGKSNKTFFQWNSN